MLDSVGLSLGSGNGNGNATLLSDICLDTCGIHGVGSCAVTGAVDVDHTKAASALAALIVNSTAVLRERLAYAPPHDCVCVGVSSVDVLRFAAINACSGPSVVLLAPGAYALGGQQLDVGGGAP